MKYLYLGFRGLEEVIEYDIKENFEYNSILKVDSGIVLFESNKQKDISKFQCIKLGMKLFSEIKKDANISVSELSELLNDIKSNNSFKIKVVRNENMEKDKAAQIQGRVASLIVENLKIKVDLKTPERIVFITASKENIYIGTNIGREISEDLSKREYKIFNSGKSLDPAFAYSCFKRIFVNSNMNEVVAIVPFCGVGILPIEMALYLEDTSRKHMIYAYDSQSFFIKSAKSNAKLAYVDDIICFDKISIDHLPEKHNNDNLPKGNFMVAHLISPSKRISFEAVEKLYVKFLDEILKILEIGSTIGIIIEKADSFLKTLNSNKKYSKLVENSRDIAYQGQLKHEIITFKIHK